MTSAAPIPLSVLDLSPIPEGGTARQALRTTVDLAVAAEAWGYKRYWLAEHHFAAVAGASPTTLVGLVAANTSTIRVGSAAVLIGFSTPVGAVEAFATVDALHPGRLDLGLGRSVQRRAETTAPTPPRAPRPPREDRVVDGLLIPAPFPIPKELLGSPSIAASTESLVFPGAQIPDFDEAVDTVLSLLDGTYAVAPPSSGTPVPLRSWQAAEADVDVWVLGSSSGQSARVAGERGLPFVAAYHIVPSGALDAVEAYRAAFRPSERLSEPYVIVSADVVVADDDETARELAAGFGNWVYDIRTGRGAQPYPRTAQPLSDDQLAVVSDRTRTQIVGSPDTVVEGLQTLARALGADEIVVTSITHDERDRFRSYELLAKAWGLPA
ncbi:LLM class flavin-dependent oxidoreductase [uncultured Williamsia sp.]|uniref:LLM class flavin-dependent oxidoreductase n=1 Tax=uncultured Williamsia sp. TaxID=259311 RepID=UPI0026167B14|nr:LLM class flavin-dependent oxidoreductase [uncultured Williamsia sp.]